MGRQTVRRIVVPCALGIVLLWLLTLPILHWLVPAPVPGGAAADVVAQRGQIGDAFGAVNALFSGLALIGVIAAILLQRDELELQRRELELTRKEFEQHRTELQRQNSLLEEQGAHLGPRLHAVFDIISSAGPTSRTFGIMIENIGAAPVWRARATVLRSDGPIVQGVSRRLSPEESLTVFGFSEVNRTRAFERMKESVIAVVVAFEDARGRRHEWRFPGADLSPKSGVTYPHPGGDVTAGDTGA